MESNKITQQEITPQELRQKIGEAKSNSQSNKTQQEVAPVKAPLPFVPRDVDEAWRFATIIAKSGLVPTPLRDKPHDVVIVLLTGQELGMSPMMSLRSLHVIEGRPSMSAEMMIARCKARPEICEYFQLISSSFESAIYKTKRTGNPEATEYEYTIEDATKAGLAKKKNWIENPRAMLRARAASGLARIEYPDIVQGIIIPDEVDSVREGAAELESLRTEDLADRLRDRIKTEDVHQEIENGSANEESSKEVIA